MTRIKLIFINAVIVGAIAIAAFQWRHALKTIGDTDDLVGVVLLELLTAGIPIVIWAAFVHYVLIWLLMKRGEMDEYHARQEIAHLPAPEQLVQPQEQRTIIE